MTYLFSIPLLFYLITDASTVAAFRSVAPNHNRNRNNYNNITTGRRRNISVLQQSLVAEVNVRTNQHLNLIYDETSDRYIAAANTLEHSNEVSKMGNKSIFRVIENLLIPEGVSDDYYSFISWRLAQRYVNAILHVFGTQSLLLALGASTKAGVVGVSAALNWVLKDCLGKVTRLVYATFTSHKLDADAKRWRFRGSLLYALGNCLEVLTYSAPNLFLLLAATANSLKQMAMLTSSATRNCILQSFCGENRGLIGDLTAKGEAQIAIVDLFGIFTGIGLSKLLQNSKVGFHKVLLGYFIVQCVEVICYYKEIRAVVFKMLNFERLWTLCKQYVDFTSATTAASSSNVLNGGKVAVLYNPEKLAEKEQVLRPPDSFSRRSNAFGSIGRAKLSPDELTSLLDMYKGEKYFIVVGKNEKKNQSRWWQFRRIKRKDNFAEDCHIVLHSTAEHGDIVKSVLNLAYLRQLLSSSTRIEARRTSNFLDIIEQSLRSTQQNYDHYNYLLKQNEWETRFMFGRVKMRSYWPLYTDTITA